VPFVEKKVANLGNSFLEYLPSPTAISAVCQPTEGEYIGPINCCTIKLKGRLLRVASYIWWLRDTKLGKDGKEQPHYYAFCGRMIRGGQGTDFNLDGTEFGDNFYRRRPRTIPDNEGEAANPQQEDGTQRV
jgi:hypothetical protein